MPHFCKDAHLEMHKKVELLNKKSLIDTFIAQEGSYRSRPDAWYGRYEGQPAAYRDPNYQYREPQPDRPSSRASQHSDRPSSRSVKQFMSLTPSFVLHGKSTLFLF